MPSSVTWSGCWQNQRWDSFSSRHSDSDILMILRVRSCENSVISAVLFRTVGDDGQNWPKDFLLRDGHLVIHLSTLENLPSKSPVYVKA